MKFNRRLLPWFIAAAVSIVAVFTSVLIFADMTLSFNIFAASVPFLLAFAGKCAEIKGYHPKVMPFLIGIPAVIAVVLIIAGSVKDAVDPFGWVNGHLYITPFLMKLFLPAVIISAVMEIIILVKRRRSGYFFDETDTRGVLSCVVIISAMAFLFYFSAWPIKYPIALNNNI